MAIGLAPSSLQRKVDRIRWWHSIDLGHGIVTPGGSNSQDRLLRMGMPADLTGKTVLDIGAWDGYFSFEAEKRGAKKVVALDQVVWNDPGIGRRGFDLARRALKSKVKAVNLEVHSISPRKVGGVFDLVLFMGVLYHVKHPLLALERVASVCAEHLILETHVDAEESDRPLLAFYPETECAHDVSNWFGPNRAAVVGMLKTVGFREVEVVWSHLDSEEDPVGYQVAGAEPGRFGRMIFHARK